jgi:hypothetical protein
MSLTVRVPSLASMPCRAIDKPESEPGAVKAALVEGLEHSFREP